MYKAITQISYMFNLCERKVSLLKQKVLGLVASLAVQLVFPVVEQPSFHRLADF